MGALFGSAAGVESNNVSSRGGSQSSSGSISGKFYKNKNDNIHKNELFKSVHQQGN